MTIKGVACLFARVRSVYDYRPSDPLNDQRSNNTMTDDDLSRYQLNTRAHLK